MTGRAAAHAGERAGSGRWAVVGTVLLSPVFVVVWSTGYLVGTLGARSGAGLALVVWRFVLAVLVVGTVALVSGAPWPRGRTVVHLMVTGALLQTVQLGGIYLGLGLGVPAGVSSLVVSSSPLLVAAVAVPLFGERLTRWQWVGLGIGLLGVAVTLSDQLTGGGHHHLAGYVLTGVAMLGLAAGTIYQKRFGATVDLRTGLTVQLVGALVTCAPLALLHGGLGIPLTPLALGSLVWLSLVNSIGALLLLFLMLRRRSGGAATSWLYLVPPVTALIGVPLLGQRVSPAVLLGMAVSVAGILLVSLARPGDRGTDPGRRLRYRPSRSSRRSVRPGRATRPAGSAAPEPRR